MTLAFPYTPARPSEVVSHIIDSLDTRMSIGAAYQIGSTLKVLGIAGTVSRGIDVITADLLTGKVWHEKQAMRFGDYNEMIGAAARLNEQQFEREQGRSAKDMNFWQYCPDVNEIFPYGVSLR